MAAYLSVPVAVMQIRVMRMRVLDRFVDVWVGVRLAAVPREVMRVLVVRVMRMQVLVFERFVLVRMLVPLAEVQPHPQCHQGARDPETDRGRLAQQQ